MYITLVTPVKTLPEDVVISAQEEKEGEEEVGERDRGSRMKTETDPDPAIRGDVIL